MTAEGNEMTLATHVLVTVPADPRAAASARGLGTVARDRGGIRRHVHRAARRRRPRPGARRLRRDEGVRALQAGTGRAGRGWTRELLGTGVTVNAMHPGWADTPGLGPRFPASAASSGRCSGRRRKEPTRSSGSPPPRTPRTSAACSSSTGERGRSTACAARAVSTRPARRRALAALYGAHGPVRGGCRRPRLSRPEPTAAKLRSVAAFRRRRSCGVAKACTSRRDRAHRRGRRWLFAE